MKIKPKHYQAFLKPRLKYGNYFSKCSKGHTHRSKLETSVCVLLHIRKQAGEIAEIIPELPVYLSAANIKYVPDFKCIRADGSTFWVEAKGHNTQAWLIKKKLWKMYGPGPLEVWKGTYLKPVLTETIEILRNSV